MRTAAFIFSTSLAWPDSTMERWVERTSIACPGRISASLRLRSSRSCCTSMLIVPSKWLLPSHSRTLVVPMSLPSTYSCVGEMTTMSAMSGLPTDTRLAPPGTVTTLDLNKGTKRSTAPPSGSRVVAAPTCCGLGAASAARTAQGAHSSAATRLETILLECIVVVSSELMGRIGRQLRSGRASHLGPANHHDLGPQLPGWRGRFDPRQPGGLGRRLAGTCVRLVEGIAQGELDRAGSLAFEQYLGVGRRHFESDGVDHDWLVIVGGGRLIHRQYFDVAQNRRGANLIAQAVLLGGNDID